MSSFPIYMHHPNQRQPPLFLNPLNYHHYGESNPTILANDPKRLHQDQYRLFLNQQIEQSKERKQKEKSDFDTNCSNSIQLSSINSVNPSSFKEVQKKKQSEYNSYLKQQIEEKERRKAIEKQKQLDDDRKYEEERLRYQRLQGPDIKAPTPYHLRPTSNNQLNNIMNTGNNIINSIQRKSIPSLSNGFDKQIVTEPIRSSINRSSTHIASNPINTELNNYIDDKFNEMQTKVLNQPQPTSTVPSFLRNSSSSVKPNSIPQPQSKPVALLKIDNCVNEVIASRGVQQRPKEMEIPSYDNRIDFSALDYRSKYEDHSTQSTSKPQSFNDSIECKDFDMSLKGISKLVNSEYDKGSVYLSTWKKADLTDGLKQSNLIKNAGASILGSSQSNFYKKDSIHKGDNQFSDTNKTNECIQSLKKFTEDLLRSEGVDNSNAFTLRSNQFNLRDSHSNMMIRPPIVDKYPSKRGQLLEDDLCNVRYSDDDKEIENELDKKLNGNKEDPKDFDDDFCRFDFNDDDDMTLSKDKPFIEEDLVQSQTAKFPSQMDFFEQSNYGSFNLQQSKQQKVDNEESQVKVQPNASSIKTIREIPDALMTTSKPPALALKQAEPIDGSLDDSRNEMYDKLLEDIDKYREMAVVDYSPEIIPIRNKKENFD